MAPALRSNSTGPDVDEAFGRVLRSLRREHGLSQEALGNETGAGRTFVSELERAEKGASLKTVFRLAGHLGLAPSDVVRLVEEDLVQNGRTRGRPPKRHTAEG